MRYWIEVFQREFMNLWRYMMISIYRLLLRIYESVLTIYERLWELWSLYDFNWEIDDVYERIWNVKVQFSHYDDGSFVINDVKSYSYVLILCGQKLKKKEVSVYESSYWLKLICWLWCFDCWSLLLILLYVLWCFRVSCGILN